MELKGFEEAKMRDARSASQGFPPNFPNEFRIFGVLARTNFSPRSRFEIPCDTDSVFALDKYKKNFYFFSKVVYYLCAQLLLSKSAEMVVLEQF